MSKTAIVIAFVLGALFLAGFVFSAVSGDGPNAAVSGVLGATLIGTALFARAEDARAQQFRFWLGHNEQALRAGGAEYEGRIVTPETKLRTFKMAVSMLVVSYRFVSAPVPEHRALGAGAAYTLVSMLLGWWGFPWGPIFTLEALFTNLTGGKRTTVGELIGAAPPA
jgi:hypothetical protein